MGFLPELAGLAAVRDLQEAEGGAWASEETPFAAATLDQMRSEFRIVSWPAADGSFRYPVWQFTRAGAIVPGIEDVLGIFKSQDQWRVMRYFLGTRHQLGGSRPLDLLREGKVDVVVDHARRHAEENTW